jgi:hypothetical protein
LSPPVPKPNPEGKKTHGGWVDEHGKQRAGVSGRDDASAGAWWQLQAKGMSSAREPTITSHVEAKLAAQMVKGGIQHVDVVLNNRPCPGLLGCDTLLPVLLPEGSLMTIHGRVTARRSREARSGRTRGLYGQEPPNDFSEGDPAIVVPTAEELDALIDRALEEQKAIASVQ